MTFTSAAYWAEHSVSHVSLWGQRSGRAADPPHLEMLETASFSNIVNLRMDFNLSRSPNPILQEGVSGWEENESHFSSDASGIGKSGCGLERQERRGGFMTSRTHIKSRFTLSGDCLATAAGLIDAVRDAVQNYIRSDFVWYITGIHSTNCCDLI